MYQPSEEILNKYAELLVNFALNDCKGIEKGDVVFLQVPECAKPILIALRRAVLKSGGHPIIQFTPDGMSKEFFELANEEQLNFFPANYLKGRIDIIDHSITIIANYDSKELEGIDARRIMKQSQAFKPFLDWKNEKENSGKFSWTLALYGTEAMAKEAGLSLEEYWQEIIKACYLDFENTIDKWKETTREVERVKEKLNSLKINKLHVKGESTDLFIGLGENRRWLGGSGRNIPSFEVYISPDCRLTEGYVKFDKPLYRYGNLIENVYLKFENGKVVDVSASAGIAILKEMIAVEGADKVGEFSLTDSRLSRITKFMAETLFDENVGGEYGNMHIALGKAYQDSYPGELMSVSKEQWKEMGYNDSVVHTDIVSSENREVTAFLVDGSSLVIYKNGRFCI